HSVVQAPWPSSYYAAAWKPVQLVKALCRSPLFHTPPLANLLEYGRKSPFPSRPEKLGQEEVPPPHLSRSSQSRLHSRHQAIPVRHCEPAHLPRPKSTCRMLQDRFELHCEVLRLRHQS